MILKDSNVLKDGEDFKRIAHLRQYKLYLVQPLDIEKFLALESLTIQANYLRVTSADV